MLVHLFSTISEVRSSVLVFPWKRCSTSRCFVRNTRHRLLQLDVVTRQPVSGGLNWMSGLSVIDLSVFYDPLVELERNQ